MAQDPQVSRPSHTAGTAESVASRQEMANDLPPELAAALRPALPDLAQEIIAAIGREVPDYARPLEGPFGRALRVGVQRALARFVDGIENPKAGDGGAREIYVALGRGEMRA